MEPYLVPDGTINSNKEPRIWPQTTNETSRKIIALAKADRLLRDASALAGAVFHSSRRKLAELAKISYSEVSSLWGRKPKIRISKKDFQPVEFCDLLEIGGFANGDQKKIWAVIATDSPDRLIDRLRKFDATWAADVPCFSEDGGASKHLATDRERRFASVVHRKRSMRTRIGFVWSNFIRFDKLIILCSDALAKPDIPINQQRIVVFDGDDPWKAICNAIWYLRESYGAGWLPRIAKFNNKDEKNTRDRDLFLTSAIGRTVNSDEAYFEQKIPAYLRKSRKVAAREISRFLEFGWVPNLSEDQDGLYYFRGLAPSFAKRAPRFTIYDVIPGLDKKLSRIEEEHFCSGFAPDRFVLALTSKCKVAGSYTRLMSCGLRAEAFGLFRRVLPEIPCDVIGIVPSENTTGAWMGKLLTLNNLIGDPEMKLDTPLMRPNFNATYAQRLLSAAIDVPRESLHIGMRKGEELCMILDAAIFQGRDLKPFELRAFGEIGRRVADQECPKLLIRFPLADLIIGNAIRNPAATFGELRLRMLKLLARLTGEGFFKIRDELRGVTDADDLEQRVVLRHWTKAFKERVFPRVSENNLSGSKAKRFNKELELQERDTLLLIAKAFAGVATLEDRQRLAASNALRLTVIAFLDDPGYSQRISIEKNPFRAASVAGQTSLDAKCISMDLTGILDEICLQLHIGDTWIGNKMNASRRNFGLESHFWIGSVAASLRKTRPDKESRLILLNSYSIGLLLRVVGGSEALMSMANRLLGNLKGKIERHSEYTACTVRQRAHLSRFLTHPSLFLEAAFDAARKGNLEQVEWDWKAAVAGWSKDDRKRSDIRNFDTDRIEDPRGFFDEVNDRFS